MNEWSVSRQKNWYPFPQLISNLRYHQKKVVKKKQVFLFEIPNPNKKIHEGRMNILMFKVHRI